MPTYNRWIRREAKRDFGRIRDGAAEDVQLILDDAYDALIGFLRFDPDTLGTVFPPRPVLRLLNCGPLRVLFRLLPPDDRTVVILGFMPNLAWSR